MTTRPEDDERLLRDALVGDHTLFTREDGGELARGAVAPVLDPFSPWAEAATEHLIALGRWNLR